MAFFGDLALGENTTLAIQRYSTLFRLKSRGSLEEIIPAVEQVLDGGHYFSPSIKKLLRFHMSQLEIDYIDRMLLKAFSKGIKQTELKDYRQLWEKF